MSASAAKPSSTTLITSTSYHALKPSGPNKPLFEHQQSLPKLPVAPLQETAVKYLRSVKAVVSEQEYAKTEAAVTEFIKPGGKGEELHKRLTEKAASEPTSWLYDWWNDWAYMAYRDPVVINVSYFFVLRDEIRKEWKAPARRAASIITGALEFKRLVVEEQLKPESTRAGPLSMDQYQWLFNACRIPAIPSDTTLVADPRKNTHIVVIRKNQFFQVETVDASGKQLSTYDIEAQLKTIYEQAGTSKAAPIGVLTSENRDVWTKTREELLKSPLSQDALDVIERSAFVVCLDDTKPVTREESSRACWHGDGRNRFFDKPIQFIIFDNGKAGFLGEHSMMDATPTNNMCDWIATGLSRDAINHGSKSSSSSVTPRKLEFDVTPAITDKIQTAEQHFDALVAKHDVRVQAFFDYGKDLIKKFKTSPDAYVQMAIQLAYYKMHGVSRPTYESASTRKFAFGRTETCRSVSLESVAWVKAMEDPSVSIAEKAQLGKRAVVSHTKYMTDAGENRGVDRLWLGLKLIMKKDEPVPAFFTDPSFDYSKHWYLSTSQIPSENYDGYGWGEVVPDGYGIAYMVNSRSLHFNIACLNEMRADRMQYYLAEALRDMRVVFEGDLAAASPAPTKAKL
ncbi:acyltransferase ChoActase/COT/CPT [Phlyctochytrium arcticum]|nr:acyltransferase ChoActase/COT/CPT [Phlyctochytrium arcticum]